MEEELLVIRLYCEEKSHPGRLDHILDTALAGRSCQWMTEAEAFQGIQNRRVLFAVDAGLYGINFNYYRLLEKIRSGGQCLSGCVGGVLVDGGSELYTKSLGRELVFSANQAGCLFPGRPLVEGTGSLANFTIQAKNFGTEPLGAYEKAAAILVEQILTFQLVKRKKPNILVIHASNYATSNTLGLWNKISRHLHDCEIQEISLRNGTVTDCAGCPYTMCRHFGQQYRCFYGGVMVEEVYPAILSCDVLILLCPNYNDAISANLSAFINRLTALFNQVRFYDKYLFGVVVSGYSGGDIVAKQLVSGLNMNKTFMLPSRFAMMETANDPGAIDGIDGIDERAEAFAVNILRHVLDTNAF